MLTIKVENVEPFKKYIAETFALAGRLKVKENQTPEENELLTIVETYLKSVAKENANK